MNPLLPSILALMIPIVAILAFSPLGRALAERLRQTPLPEPQSTDDVLRLQQRVLELEQLVLYQQKTLGELQESVQFFEALQQKQNPETSKQLESGPEKS